MAFLRRSIGVLLLLLSLSVAAQQNDAVISGRVVDEAEKPLPGVSVQVQKAPNGVVTSDSGTFIIKVPSGRTVTLSFSYAGFQSIQRHFFLDDHEEEKVIIRLITSSKVLEEVIIKDNKERIESGLVRVNPKYAISNPSATGGVEGLIKIFVGSNNELTSQYSVRGGNYDENLVYVNDFEIFRPYLIRNGQQEGLSFINPELTGGINFYNGGFQAKYGDKMSSVLDVQYKKPKSSGASAYVGLLEQGFHVEGTGMRNRVTYLIGARNRSNRNLLSSQEIKGHYVPTSSDIQGLFTFCLSPKWHFALLGIISGTRFSLIPEEAKMTSSVLSPLFTQNLGLDIFFDGREKDSYQTNMLGLSVIQQVNEKLKLKWMLSRFQDDEKELFDITGAYLFGERSFDKTQSDFGSIINPLGAGVFIHHARNRLSIENISVAQKGEWSYRKHFVQWGVQLEKTRINDRLNEWELQDSAGYNLPYRPDQLQLSAVRKSATSLNIAKFSGYIQDNLSLGQSSGMMLQGGIRFNYNGLNHEFLISPRAQISWMPDNDKDWVFRLSAGAYHQPPFYRELRRLDGTVNPSVKAQRSWQTVIGADHNFSLFNRPSRMTVEAYYKHLTHVDPYDLDNVRIRYFGNNDAKAYATGIELRLFSELVKDAESWVSIGLMRTKEKIDNFSYFRYKNASGEWINAQTEDKAVADSVRFDKGWMRRPTDRLFTLGLFFQDYLSTNKNFKVHVNSIFGSDMPYSVPGSVRYRNGLIIDPYFRVDIGFSALLLDGEKRNRRSHDPFKQFKTIWASIEVFNLLDRNNTISYLLIKDFSNAVYAIPNRLTPRLLNFKILARF